MISRYDAQLIIGRFRGLPCLAGLAGTDRSQSSSARGGAALDSAERDRGDQEEDHRADDRSPDGGRAAVRLRTTHRQEFVHHIPIRSDLVMAPRDPGSRTSSRTSSTPWSATTPSAWQRLSGLSQANGRSLPDLRRRGGWRAPAPAAAPKTGTGTGTRVRTSAGCPLATARHTLCNDGTYSYAATTKGACSHQGGVTMFCK